MPRNDCAVVRMPTLKPISPSQAQPSSTAVTAHTARGRRAITPPAVDARSPGPRAHGPPADGSAVPNRGRTGQKIHRPVITSRAGSKVIMTSSPTPMPIAATGPSPDMSAESAASRHAMPAITVAALATIAGPARRSAAAIASCRSECPRSSSR